MTIRELLGIALLAAGIGFLFMPLIKNQAYDKEQKDILEALERMGTFEESAVTVEADGRADTLAEPEGQEYLAGTRGLLEIDKIGLKMAVFEGVTDEALRKGAGMIEPDKKIGLHNIGLAGHRAVDDGKQFNRLGELKPGDEMVVRSGEGNYTFIVTDTFVVDQSDTAVLDDAEQPLLTLVTCTPIGSWRPTDRLIVRGELKEIGG